MRIKGRELEFDESTHTYFVDGKKVESVTQLINRLFPDKYADIPEGVLKRASERGTQVHKAIEAYCKGFDDGSNEVMDFKFLQSHYKFKAIENELPVIIDLNGKTYAGTLDMILKTNSEFGYEYSIADIKTTSTLDKNYLAYQLNLYRLGAMYCYDYDITALYGIHINGKVRKLVKIPIIEDYRLIEAMEGVL